MSEYKRLTPKDRIELLNVNNSGDMTRFILYANRLWDIENMLKSGMLIKPPCKVGDVFFGFSNKTDAPNQYFKYIVKGIEYREDGVYLRTIYDMSFKYGDEAFMAETVAKLKELKGE